jgi:hypothetical protein
MFVHGRGYNSNDACSGHLRGNELISLPAWMSIQNNRFLNNTEDHILDPLEYLKQRYIVKHFIHTANSIIESIWTDTYFDSLIINGIQYGSKNTFDSFGFLDYQTSSIDYLSIFFGRDIRYGTPDDLVNKTLYASLSTKPVFPLHRLSNYYSRVRLIIYNPVYETRDQYGYQDGNSIWHARDLSIGFGFGPSNDPLDDDPFHFPYIKYDLKTRWENYFNRNGRWPSESNPLGLAIEIFGEDSFKDINTPSSHTTDYIRYDGGYRISEFDVDTLEFKQVLEENYLLTINITGLQAHTLRFKWNAEPLFPDDQNNIPVEIVYDPIAKSFKYARMIVSILDMIIVIGGQRLSYYKKFVVAGMNRDVRYIGPDFY